MWWRAVAPGTKLRTDSRPLFFPSCVSLHSHHNSSPPPPPPFFMSLCLCQFPLGGVSHRLLSSSYTNWGQRMCRLSLDCCLPLRICTNLPPVPWHPLLPPFSHTHAYTRSLQTQPGVHALSPFSVNIKHTARVGTDTVMWVLALTHPRLQLYQLTISLSHSDNGWICSFSLSLP